MGMVRITLALACEPQIQKWMLRDSIKPVEAN
jgi:hypothetical protein